QLAIHYRGAADDAVSGVANGVAGLGELRMVERVVCLGAELQQHTFPEGQAEAAMQSEIEVVAARAGEHVTSLLAEDVRGGRREAACIEPLRDGSVRKIAAARPVGIGRVARIGIVEVQYGSERQSALHGVDGADLPKSRDLAQPSVVQEFAARTER